jgi:benzylsuccinate CoA-transferase BbsE subunit
VTAPQALHGLRVLDCSGPSGQYAGKLFAELGADVLLIEPPGGSPVRREAPFLDGHDGPDASMVFTYFNSGKRGMLLDLDVDEGQQLLHRLAMQADVLIESEKPGVMAHRGLDAAALMASAPRLVVTSITPFGQNGPYAEYECDEIVALALGGLLSLGGYPDTEPLAPYGNQAQLAAAQFAAVATLIALWEVEGDASAHGTHVDVSMQQCVAMGLENAVQYVDLEGTVRRREGGQQRQAGTGVFDCADGQIFLMAGGVAANRFWSASVQWLLDEGVGDARDLQQPRWSDFDFLATAQAKQRFAQIFAPFARTRTKADLYRSAQGRRIPLCPIATPADLPASAQLRHRGFFVEMLHSASGRRLLAPGAPYRLSETPWRAGRPAPRLGEHTSDVLRELGCSAADEAHWRAAKVVA